MACGPRHRLEQTGDLRAQDPRSCRLTAAAAGVRPSSRSPYRRLGLRARLTSPAAASGGRHRMERLRGGAAKQRCRGSKRRFTPPALAGRPVL